jgi:hypothetical protein
MKKSFFAIAAIVLALIVGGCAKLPQVELDSAKAAIEKANLAQANVYLTPDYAALMDSMNSVNAEIELINGHFFKNFTEVKSKLSAIESEANALVTKTEAKKESIKQEVLAMVSGLKSLASENGELVSNAPKGKEGKAAIEAIKSELSVIDGSTLEIEQLIEQGSLIPAQNKAKATFDKATAINMELKTVVEKYNKKKK